jgi:ADP-heptose:LPS heptosyltransferase
VTCTLPVAAALRRGHPGSEVVWLVDQRFVAIAERCASIDRVVVLPKKYAEIRETIKGLGEFDAALDMQGLLKSALPVALAKAKEKLGYHWQREGSAFVTRAVRPDPTSLHIVDQYVDVARAAGGVAERADFDFHSKPDDEESVRQKLAAKGWTDAPIVAINAGAGWASKRWPVEKVAFVADQLADAGGTPVFLGAPGDKAVFDQVAQCMTKPPLSLVGETGIGEMVGLLSLAKMHLGGDTGSTHIAAALGRPAFGTYIMTRPERSCPYGQIDRCRTLDEREVAHAMIAELERC